MYVKDDMRNQICWKSSSIKIILIYYNYLNINICMMIQADTYKVILSKYTNTSHI